MHEMKKKGGRVDLPAKSRGKEITVSVKIIRGRSSTGVIAYLRKVFGEQWRGTGLVLIYGHEYLRVFKKEETNKTWKEGRKERNVLETAVFWYVMRQFGS